LYIPQKAVEGSSGRGISSILPSFVRLMLNLWPAFNPSFFLISPGITTCPLVEVLTIAIVFYLDK